MLTRVGVGLFLVWRLAKPGLRIIRRLVGRDKLPFDFHAKILWGCLIGLGSYHASRWRIASQTRQSGGSRPRLTPQLWEVWHYRELIWNLTARDLKVKYQRSWLGFLWTLLNPLVTVAVLIAVFSYVVRLPIRNYWAFLLSGYFAWNFFSLTLNGGVQAAVGNALLTRSAYFPQEVIIISSALARLLEFFGELAIILILLAVFHHKGFPLSFLMILPITLILLLFSIGISFPLVTLAVYYEDTVQAIPLATIALFYASPVFYTVDLVPESVRVIYLLNPVALILSLWHTALYQGEMPDLLVLLVSAGIAIVFAWLGYALFNRKKREFAEIV